jgi:hypothetical protein
MAAPDAGPIERGYRVGNGRLQPRSVTSWQSEETKFTRGNAKNIQCPWRVKTDNKPIRMRSFTEPLIVPGVSIAIGVKNLTTSAGSFDDIYAIALREHVRGWCSRILCDSRQNALLFGGQVGASGCIISSAKEVRASPKELRSAKAFVK